VQLPRRPLIAHFSEAALEVLDPYTVMVWPRQVQDFEKMMMNEFSGVGIEISKPRGMLTVASLLPDTPAYRAGLDAGDVIVAVDGVPTKDMSLTCAVKKITGPKGTSVVLSVKRPAEEEPEEIKITRDRIIVPTIRGWQRTEAGTWLYVIDEANRVGYVRITSFSGETASDFEDVLRDLEAEGLKGLIIDLRFNTGGLLDSAVNIVDKFIKEGLIVRTQPRIGMIPSYEYAHRRGTHPDYPIVILINSGSASASEIVAGALADPKYKRAVLVGDRTHGKGSVQGITHYPGGGAQLKYTMAYYHLPSGQRVKSRDAVEKEGRKDWGVGANVEIKLNSNEMREMLDVQRDNDVLVQATREEHSDSYKKRTLEETLKADPQLAVGLLVVKAKLIEGDALVTN
jgi:carboxyl-terminal processing protease